MINRHKEPGMWLKISLIQNKCVFAIYIQISREKSFKNSTLENHSVKYLENNCAGPIHLSVTHMCSLVDNDDPSSIDALGNINAVSRSKCPGLSWNRHQGMRAGLLSMPVIGQFLQILSCYWPKVRPFSWWPLPCMQIIPWIMAIQLSHLGHYFIVTL